MPGTSPPPGTRPLPDATQDYEQGYAENGDSFARALQQSVGSVSMPQVALNATLPQAQRYVSPLQRPVFTTMLNELGRLHRSCAPIWWPDEWPLPRHMHGQTANTLLTYDYPKTLVTYPYFWHNTCEIAPQMSQQAYRWLENHEWLGFFVRKYGRYPQACFVPRQE
jgi:hypothetical protein